MEGCVVIKVKIDWIGRIIRGICCGIGFVGMKGGMSIKKISVIGSG